MKFYNIFKVFCMSFFALCMTVCMCGCNMKCEAKESNADYNFEYHYLAEDFEEKYDESNENIIIEEDKEYLICLEASCIEGTMQIQLLRDGQIAKTYTVSKEVPCQEKIMVPANTAKTVDIRIGIEADTNGSVVGEIKVS